jgi:hypothetical protein
MPRRPKKDANGNIIKKVVTNPGGRPKTKGTAVSDRTKAINNDLREAFALLLQKKIPELEQWLTAAAERNPIKALEIFTAISERFLPSLSRTEIANADGTNFTPIQISIPTLNMIQAPPANQGDIPVTIPIDPSIQQPRVLAPPQGFIPESLDGLEGRDNQGDVPQEFDVSTSIGEGTPTYLYPPDPGMPHASGSSSGIAPGGEAETSPIPWVPKFELPPSALLAKSMWEAAPEPPGRSFNKPR